MSLSLLIPGMITGSVLALGLWTLFRLVPRIAPDIRAWSWRLVLLKLAVSAFAIGQVSLYLLPAAPSAPGPRSLPSPPPVLRQITGLDAPAAFGKVQSLTPIEAAVPVIHPALVHKSPEPSGTNPWPFIFGFWAAGIALLFVRALFVTVRTRRDLRDAVPVTNPEIAHYLETISSRAGLRRTPRLVCLDSTQSPMVYGIWRPVIVLPLRLASSSCGDVELAVGHEIAHIRRGDLIWTAVACLVRSVLFFNPVAWLAESELRASQESATDQETVWITGASVAVYAKMLLSSMRPDQVSWQPSGLAMFDSFVSSQRRLRAMQQFSQRPRLTQKLMVAALLVAGVGCLPTYTVVRAAAAIRPRQKPEENSKTPPARTALKAAKGIHAEGLTHPVIKPRLHALIPTLNESAGRRPTLNLTNPSKPQPDVRFVEEETHAGIPPESGAFKTASKAEADAFNNRVNQLVADQDKRIADYRRGADEREREAEQREREGQQRKRDGEQRARAALLREQVIEEHERNGYQIVGPGQREVDAKIRKDDARQREADVYQGVLDQRQRETDQWQRTFDEKSVAAMRKETQTDIAAARSQYRKRIAELAADDASRRKEATGAAAYPETQAKLRARSGLHTVKTASGLSFAVPDGYDVVRVQTIGKDSYTVVLKQRKN